MEIASAPIDCRPPHSVRETGSRRVRRAVALRPPCCDGCGTLARENDRLRAQLRARRAELDGAAARILQAGDVERRRLERNLHDGAQQRLVGIALHLRLLALRAGCDAETRTLLDTVQDELAASLQELREIARGLHPAVLSDHGLATALRAIAERAALDVHLDVRLASRPCPAAETAAYYLVAEALTNIARHADAATASVRVERRDARLLIEIADDGVGGADPAAGSGLRGLVDRVEALGGRLAITSAAGAGTTLRAEIPCGT